MFRRLAHDSVVVERRVHVGQNRPLRIQATDPIQRLLERQMARMVSVLQRIDDQHVEILKFYDGFRRKVADVAAISDIADTKSQ